MASPSGTNTKQSLPIEWVLVVVFLALAAWFLWGSPPANVPHAVTPVVDRSEIRPGARRQIQGDHPVAHIAGLELKCNQCHSLFDPPVEPMHPLVQHTQIKLNHGINDRCFNCHDRENREMLALRGGRTIPFSRVARLCAKCHGPTYRDWQKGMHGKSMGSWDEHSPEQRRLRCSECHDPHSPAFPLYKPLPGPHTLRMEETKPSPHEEPVEMVDPLRKWQRELNRQREEAQHQEQSEEHNDTDEDDENHNDSDEE